jgi:hypothetical protein
MKNPNQQELNRLIDEAIKLEQNMAGLYNRFAYWFPEDKEFWWTLVMEEKNHAALLRSGKESFLPNGLFPTGMLPDSRGELETANQKISEFIQQYKGSQPSKSEAFNIAYAMERSAGEYHFQFFMDKPVESNMERVFKQLNQGDKDHAFRIYQYMVNQGIAFEGEYRI